EGHGAVQRAGDLRHAPGIQDVLVAVRVGVVFQHGDGDGLGAVGDREVVGGDGAIDADKHGGGQRGRTGVVGHDVAEAVGAGEAAEGCVGEGLRGGVERDRAVGRAGEQRHAAGELNVLVAVRIGIVVENGDIDRVGAVGVDPIVAGDGTVDDH